MAERTVTLGVGPEGPVRVPVGNAVRHGWCTGSSGWGKSAWVTGLVLQLLRDHADVDVTIVDPKGEMVDTLLGSLLPSLEGSLPGVTPASTLVIEAFGDHGVPLDLLARGSSLPPEVRAFNAAHLLSGLTGGAGPRMVHVATELLRAIARHPTGTVLDLAPLLTSASYRRGYASVIEHPEARRYLLERFDEEPDASISSLVARVDQLCILPGVRGLLGAKAPLDASRLVDGHRLVLASTGGSPQGFTPVANLLGAFLVQILSAAIFDRPVGGRRRLIVVDEWVVLARGAGLADEFERLLSLARFKNIAFFLVNQNAAQVRAASPELEAALLTNIARHIAFRPEAGDLKHAERLLPVTGRAVDPRRVDRLLPVSEEREALLQRLAGLPERHALHIDRLRGTATEMRALAVPFEEARRRSESLGADRLLAWRRGALARPIAELIAEAVPNAVPFVEDDDVPQRGGRGRSTRPRLKVPE